MTDLDIDAKKTYVIANNQKELDSINKKLEEKGCLPAIVGYWSEFPVAINIESSTWTFDIDFTVRMRVKFNAIKS